MDKLSSDYLLPIGGMLIALFAGWRMSSELRKHTFAGFPDWLDTVWMWILRIVAPGLVGFVFLNKLFGWVE